MLRLHTHFTKAVEYPVTVIIPDGITYRAEDRMVKHPTIGGEWMTLQIAAARGFIQAIPFEADAE